MSDDPLTDILELADARCVMSGGLAAGGGWALTFPPPGMIKFVAIARGACWLTREGEPDLRLETGDAVMLPPDRSFGLADDRDAAALDGASIFADAIDNLATIADGETFLAVGGHVIVDRIRGAALTDLLPPFLHVEGCSPEASALRWLLDRLVKEVPGTEPGARLAADQLAQLVLIQILRVHLARAEPMPVGSMRALGDPRIAPALRLMHRDPARAWRLGELANAVGMSRTSFAVRFKAAAGVAPLTYLLNWRMRLAEQKLQQGAAPVADVARLVGYSSESAFSHAFKRMTGAAPTRYRSVFATMGSATARQIPAPSPAHPLV